MFPIIQNLDKKKVFKLEILVCNSYIHKKSKEHPNIANYIHLYENNLIVTFKKRVNKLINKILNFFKDRFIDVNYLPHLIDSVIENEKKIKSALSFDKYLSAVIYTDRTIDNGFTPALLKVLNENSIPLIMPPIAESSIYLRKRRLDSNYYADKHPDLMKKYPNSYIFDTKTNKNIFFYRIKEMNSLIKLGLMPKIPWMNGGGLCDKVLLSSEFVKNYFINKGVDSKKLIVTGQISHDNVFNSLSKKETIKSKIFKTYRLKHNPKIIILSLPPLADEGMNEKMTIEEYLFLFSSLAKVNATTLISLHPRLSRNFITSLIKKNQNIIVVEERLHDIIPISDLFLCCGSSTIVLSLSKVPVINFDFYNYKFLDRGYDKFSNLISDKSKFVPLINTLLFDKDYNSTEIKRISRISNQLSPFDGKSKDRIISEITNQ